MVINCHWCQKWDGASEERNWFAYRCVGHPRSPNFIVFFPGLLHSYHMTFSGSKQTTSVLTTNGEYSMDNEFQALLTLLSLLAYVVQSNSALYSTTAVYRFFVFVFEKINLLDWSATSQLTTTIPTHGQGQWTWIFMRHAFSGMLV